MYAHLKNLSLSKVPWLESVHEVIWNGNYTGIYTNVWIARESLLDVMNYIVELFIWIMVLTAFSWIWDYVT